MSVEHVDVLIVGAGISGIGAAYHLQEQCPRRTFAILEARDALGGTWDLFRYPGIRSDSDMYTLGYAFRPWKDPKAIADGPAILAYLHETAEAYGIDRKIRLGHRVTRAEWSTENATWTVTAERGPEREIVQVTCRFLLLCAGYYEYENGYTPAFSGVEHFRGRIVHPQHWTPDVDYDRKRVVVIGSGATAVTLVPELAKSASHVTMLQRSPTYVISRPAEDWFAQGLRRLLPERLVYAIVRWTNVILGMFFFWISRNNPKGVRDALIERVQRELGPDYDVGTHFAPNYGVWDQRVCLVPDGDLFEAIRGGRASVVTDHVDTFTESGIRLKSGVELDADLVVTATGLELKVAGGVSVVVDGSTVNLAETMTYKGMMYSNVPNLAFCFGYTNASWTLKCDLTCEYVCRLLNHLEGTGYKHCTPRENDPSVLPQPWLDFTSGYVQRSLARFPKQGSKAPWRLHQNYALDAMSLRYGALEDGALEFAG
jgi:cation diffusion facilitator CzcD-associated flavoprotein CzcO